MSSSTPSSFYSPRARRVLWAVAEAMFEEDGENVSSKEDNIAWFLQELELLFDTWEGVAKALPMAAPWVFEFSPLLVGHGFELFSHLDIASRARVLKMMEESENNALASFFGGLKVIFSIVYFEQPRVLPEMGLDMNGLKPINFDHLKKSFESLEEAS